MRGLDPGTLRGCDAGPSAGLISPSMLLTSSPELARRAAHCCLLHLRKELSRETGRVLTAAWSSAHHRAAQARSLLPFALEFVSAVVAQSLCQLELCLYPFPSELRDACFGTSSPTASTKCEGRHGADPQCRSAEGFPAADVTLQVPIRLGLHQDSTHPFVKCQGLSAAQRRWLHVV